MEQRHPSERRLAEYWFEVLAPEEQIEVSLHLLACESCRRSLEALPKTELDPQEVRATRGREVEAVLESAFSAARLRVSFNPSDQQNLNDVVPADRLLEELDDQTIDRQLATVGSDRRFQSPQLVDRLIGRSRDLAGEEPGRALGSAKLAIEIAQNLDPRGHERPETADRLARAWAFAGNAQRVLTDLAEASKAFVTAERWLAKGTADRGTRARVLSLKASLQRARRSYDEAASTLLEVLEIRRLLEDRQAEGEALVLYAKVLYFIGELEAAIATLREAEDCLRSLEPNRLTFILHHDRFLCLIESGRLDEACHRFDGVRDLCEAHGSTSDRLNLRWNEARLNRELGQTEKAIEGMTAVRQGFIERSNGYDAALVSLDLAEIFFSQGRTNDTRQLVSEVLPLLKARDVAPGVLAAMNLLLRSIEADTANRGLLEGIRSQLDRSSL